jgi:hypothetical protein
LRAVERGGGLGFLGFGGGQRGGGGADLVLQEEELVEVDVGHPAQQGELPAERIQAAVEGGRRARSRARRWPAALRIVGLRLGAFVERALVFVEEELRARIIRGRHQARDAILRGIGHLVATGCRSRRM